MKLGYLFETTGDNYKDWCGGSKIKMMAPEDGLEPPTQWLTATCSTN
jgi:hypothetical protein